VRFNYFFLSFPTILKPQFKGFCRKYSFFFVKIMPHTAMKYELSIIAVWVLKLFLAKQDYSNSYKPAS